MKKVKAQNWKFNRESISPKDLETCLRIFHYEWYDKMDEEDLYGQDAIHFIEINALLVNGIICISKTKAVKDDKTIYSWVDYHEDLELSEDFKDWLADISDEYSDVEIIEKSDNEEVKKILSNYKF